MPATSEAQRRAMCLALNVKLGKQSAKSVSPEIRKMAREMSVSQLSDFCHSPVQKGG